MFAVATDGALVVPDARGRPGRINRTSPAVVPAWGEAVEERRQSERHQLMFHATVMDAEAEAALGQLIDISITGLMLASEAPLEIGRRYRLYIPLPIPFDGYNEIRLRATAAWTAAALHPEFHRTGFKDLQLPEEQQRAFQRLVDEYRLRAAAG